nr:MAG TPA: hypothetical protein [Caudoviricetes sp.]
MNLSGVCAVIAGVLMVATPIVFLVWLVKLIRKKPAKKTGMAVILCAVLFVVSVLAGAFSTQKAEGYSQTGKPVNQAAQEDVEETQEEEMRYNPKKATDETYQKDVKSFAKKHKIPESLAGSLKDAMEQSDSPFGFDEINGWESADDWALGSRYRAWTYRAKEDKYYWILIYEKGGKVESLYDITDGERLIYEVEKEDSGQTDTIAGSIRIVDGEIGEYGKKVQLDSYEYIWYMVPAGKYEAIGNAKNSIIYIDKDEITRNAEGYVEMQNVATYTVAKGETVTIEIGEGEHVYNTYGADFTLRRLP